MVPIIDLSETVAEKRIIEKIDFACQHFGSFVLTGHGIPSDVVAHAYKQSRLFFDLPMSAKKELQIPNRGMGYLPQKIENFSAMTGEVAKPDLRESFNVEANVTSIPWPKSLPNFQKSIVEYFEYMNNLARKLTAFFAYALQLPGDYFEPYIDHPKAVLRIAYYPHQTEPPPSQQLRAGAHTDCGILTILKLDDAPGGLQIKNEDGNWIDITVPADAFFINLGDIIMRWTNNRWQSKIHRVVNPPIKSVNDNSRLSLVFFFNPNPDATISCLQSCYDEKNPPIYAPFNAGEFVRARTSIIRDESSR